MTAPSSKPAAYVGLFDDLDEEDLIFEPSPTSKSRLSSKTEIFADDGTDGHPPTTTATTKATTKATTTSTTAATTRATTTSTTIVTPTGTAAASLGMFDSDEDSGCGLFGESLEKAEQMQQAVSECTSDEVAADSSIVATDSSVSVPTREDFIQLPRDQQLAVLENLKKQKAEEAAAVEHLAAATQVPATTTVEAAERPKAAAAETQEPSEAHIGGTVAAGDADEATIKVRRPIHFLPPSRFGSALMSELPQQKRA